MRLEDEIKQHLIVDLEVPDVTPGEIGDEEPLFGEGLGFDSLDAVEVVAMLKRHYQVQLRDRGQARKVMATVQTLADYVRDQRPDDFPRASS